MIAAPVAAVRQALKLRLALVGPPKSGKTMTALRFARKLAGPQGRILVFDTEHRSVSKYVGTEPGFQFDVIPHVDDYSPETYCQVLELAAQNKYDVVILDSLSHAWMGPGGVLEIVDASGKKDKGGNKFAGWAEGTPRHRRLIEAILGSPIHVISTMRSKVEWGFDDRKRPVRLGMGVVQRDDTEYEFDILVDMDDATATVNLTRCPAIRGKVWREPTGACLDPVIAWLDGGAQPAPAPTVGNPEPAQQPPAQRAQSAPASSPEPEWVETARGRAHRSWLSEEGSFAAHLELIGREHKVQLTYEELARWLRSKNKPAPWEMDSEGRKKFLDYLALHDGRQRILDDLKTNKEQR